MATKYIPANKNEIRNFRRERAIKERKRKEITESSYIALRRMYLQIRKENPAFEQTATKFNSYIKELKHNQAMDVFRYYVADIY
jgi:TRAP-type mannitol/chloroaromatic compound transport system substrate-binding protein